MQHVCNRGLADRQTDTHTHRHTDVDDLPSLSDAAKIKGKTELLVFATARLT